MKISALFFLVSIIGISSCHGWNCLGESSTENADDETDDKRFDVSKPDTSKAPLNAKGQCERGYKPKNQNIKQIVDGGIPVWTAKDEEYCSYIVIHSPDKNTGPDSIVISLNGDRNNTKKYYKDAGNWREVIKPEGSSTGTSKPDDKGNESDGKDGKNDRH
ncbi:signal peptide-containing protein [Theileria equi strain WA]|uniref:Signal peptide-containing protein n=1 Tax=Theileria equi strain WA TaxID=1537102 RepID=L0AZH1_THEEQ|nr:signal peptide-containing protein [Theileria equi strain WA]AFZ80987.1 signal peptide-containing protein [Theileria equi strain WA]|eukprot:XP_004830653.1 signal peptide-containing protein [Theileria equi strain WA]